MPEPSTARKLACTVVLNEPIAPGMQRVRLHCGPAIHAVAVRMAWEACNAVEIPVCGIGGIRTGEDAAEFILAGCCAVEVGTQNFVDPTSAPRIAAELEQWAADQGVSDINELIGAFEC